ncbi:MAG: polysaccharide deacetylase family protein [Actinobacteria bacterium]|nr:polysaccharide deacetylase family protein [Actinomycetota bacterium]
MPLRRVVAVVLLALVASGARGATGSASSTPLAPLQLHASRLRQDGAALVWSLATARPWTSDSLARDGRSLCLRLAYRAGDRQQRDVCVARSASGAAPALVYARVLRSGGDGPLHPLSARVRRPDDRSFVARFDPARAGIPYAPVRWRTRSSARDCTAGAGLSCSAELPPGGAVLRLRAPTPIGCTPAGPAYVTNGSRSRRVVALTFDDGPWSTTAAVLKVLERERVHATFFLIGRQVAGGAALARRELADGDMIGDHTWSHADVAAGGSFAAGQISSTANAIQRATGFRPCLFRAPYGAVGASLIRTARGLGFTTVQWDVDPRDWSLPGSAAIYANVVGHVRDGSIVLMHDGGGPRGQTLAALPGIIRTLRARGFGFVTVDQLTGATLRYA